MKIIFQRGDALLDDHPEVEDIEVVVSGDVQLTYASLREVDTSNPIAVMDENGLWHIEDRIEVRDHGPYTDIVITEDNLT